jgi:Mn2+/Fe2+ NRAMP family transporter
MHGPVGHAIVQAVRCLFLATAAQVSPVGFVVDKVALGQIFLGVLHFSLSVSFHHCSIFTYVSSFGWTVGPLVAHFHRDIVSPHRINEIIGQSVPLIDHGLNEGGLN